jgi:hypothetical protein
MARGAPHSATARGRWARVKLKTGEVVELKFKEKTAGKILIFENAKGEERRIAIGEIQSMSDRRLLQPISRHKRV